ncbi:hypothetical protein V8E53_010352 [Lactarius tabidus]
MLVSPLRIFATLAVTAAVGASAQSLDLAPECAINCWTSAMALGGCASLADVTCVCTSTTFKSIDDACLKKNCSGEEQHIAARLQKEECADVEAV